MLKFEPTEIFNFQYVNLQLLFSDLIISFKIDMTHMTG
jgi:hypothetical protein